MTFERAGVSVTASGTLPRVPFVALKEKILGPSYTLSIAFLPPSKATSLNRTYRKKTYTPETLSFALSKTNGEIILCKSALRTQSKERGVAYEQWIIYILIHSMLHLKGMTHGSTMERKEKRLHAFFTSAHAISSSPAQPKNGRHA